MDVGISIDKKQLMGSTNLSSINVFYAWLVVVIADTTFYRSKRSTLKCWDFYWSVNAI